MKTFITSLVGLAVCLSFVLAATAQKKAVPKRFTTSGFYNDIEMTCKESGDYGGVSVFLTQSDTQTFALVTVAEGTIFNPVLVEAKTSGKDMRTIEFTLPGDNGGRSFKGTVSAAALTLNEGGTKTVLKRGCANAYSNIKMGSGGDLGGTEVYITDSGGSWFALVTFAEGVLGSPTLVPATATGKNYSKIAFTIAGANGERKFTATRGATTLTLSEGGAKSILKAKCYK